MVSIRQRPRAARLLLVLVIGVLTAGTALAETRDLKATFTISGSVQDIHQTTSTSGFTFQVRLKNIDYKGQVVKTLMERTDAGKLTVWLALRDVVLTINRTEITGRRHRAGCGPLEIELANRRELWLAFDVAEQESAKGDRQLQLLKTRFGLTPDNWSVGSPDWVRTSGLGMTQSKVVSGLRRGLEVNPDGITERLIGEGPFLFDKVEDRVQQALTTKFVAARASGL